MENHKKPSHIVGIGGSAGGLEAFEEFLKSLPPKSGMAFVVVQHLDPTHEAMLTELLRRRVDMPVNEITDGMKVEPDNVYVIPPNKDLSILHGTLQLMEPSAPRGMRLPIDFFFKQLAQDQGENAVAVILSGMGTDGSSGLKVIKEHFGTVMVQDPDTAKFDGMPRSAIATNLADYVAPASELPAKLVEYARHTVGAPARDVVLSRKAIGALEKTIVLLRSHTGHDFSLYKTDTLNRRISRRMDVHLITSMDDYVRYLQGNPSEVDLLFRELLIGVTSFFRNPETFEKLKEKVITHLLTGGQGRESLRAWVIGCATGEEAYSLAIILRESLDALDPRSAIDIQIFATDIDKEAVEVARRAVYPANISADVSPERLQRFFVKEDERYRVKKEVRDAVVFAPHNVIMDPPFTKMDVVSCRNLLIYFSPELQKKIVPLFHYSLNPGGILFLGPSESIAGFTDTFSALDNKSKLFQRRGGPGVRPHDVEFPASRKSQRPVEMKQAPEVSVAEMAQRMLLEQYAPPSVLINPEGDILFINGRTGNYLEPSPGKANMNIYAMAREGLRHELAVAIRKSNTQGTDVVLKNLNVKNNGGVQAVDVMVRPVRKRDERDLLLVVFQDVKSPARAKLAKAAPGPDDTNYLNELQDELAYARERLQDTTEQMQASQEELQSANEELQSANEELQSTNEEMTTSKEEMQSLNEELATVNAELQAKLDQLSHVNNDLRNLLNSTEIATIFLDSNLHIKRFTPQATEIFKMIGTDLERPITDLVSSIEYGDLASDARKVIETLVVKEQQVRTLDGRWYSMRIVPYRTVDNVIDGVVMTFGDITELKNLQQSLLEERNLAESIIATVREPLLILDSDLRVISASRSFYQAFHVRPEETDGKTVFDLGNKQWDTPMLRELLEHILPENTEFDGFKVEHDFPGLGYRVMLLNARRIKREDRDAPLILLAFEDVTGCERA